MTPRLTHFAINTNDVDATRNFYGSVFGWQFREYGPPGFLQILDGDNAMGAIQQRRDLIDGEPTRGFECTFGVDDIGATRDRIVAAGGTILMDSAIPSVGHLIAFQDPGGNPVLVMEYET